MTLDADGLMERISLAKERTRLANERNRLANERTFLSWIRTGLAILGGGVAVVRLLTFQNVIHQVVAQVCGILLIILGIVMFILSAIDYIKSLKALKLQPSIAGSPWTIMTIAMVLAGIAITLILVLATHK